jgi:hypothetical protein
LSPFMSHAPPIYFLIDHLYNSYHYPIKRELLDQVRPCFLLTTGQQLITEVWFILVGLSWGLKLWGVGGNGGCKREGYEIGRPHGIWGLQLVKGLLETLPPHCGSYLPFHIRWRIDLSWYGWY